jgi:hypothetical protein
MTAPAVYAAIAAVQAALAKEGISKNRRNQQQGFAFRGIDDVYSAVASLLPANGLTIIPRMIARECDPRTTKSGGAMYFVTVEAEFDFVAVADGSKHTARTFGEASDSGDKATNKAMSAALKYAVLMTFTVPTEGDNDADAHTPEPTEPPQRTAKMTPEQWLDDQNKRLDAMLKAADIDGIHNWPAAEAKALAKLQSTNPEAHAKALRIHANALSAIRAAG